MKKITLLSILSLLLSISTKAQNSYFPPANPAVWDTISPLSLNWCADKIDSLYDFLEQKNSKAFIVLKGGKIVLEKYFGTFNQDSLWYWASAGKTLTAFLTGVAKADGQINLNNSITSYLGSNWSSCNSAQEDSITVKHLLTMSSGLDDIPPSPCTNEDDTPICLQYLAPANSRWSYHTGAYRKLQEIISAATGTSLNVYSNAKVKSKISMSSGTWVQDVFYSKLRDAARFGLLLLNKGIWSNDTILHDSLYFHEMVNTSQNNNLSYGYLTWLNGKSSFMLPSVQAVFPGYIAPDAPADLYCALGKNDQKIYVVPSQDLVVVRLGNSAYSSNLSITVFDNEIWQKINQLTCSPTAAKAIEEQVLKTKVIPNPFVDFIQIAKNNATQYYQLVDIEGQIIYEGKNISEQNFMPLHAGIYFLKIRSNNGTFECIKLIKQ